MWPLTFPKFQSVVNLGYGTILDLLSKSMSYKRRQKIDLFSLLLVVVTMGLFLTVAYQLHLFYGNGDLPVANELSARSAADG